MGGGPISPLESSFDNLLTPSLFSLLAHHRLPYPDKKAPINFSDFGRDIFLEDPFSPLVKDKAWPALLALSKFGSPDQVPDLTTYLPHPTDTTYPVQVLGLQLLVDNLPRLLFRGIDARWIYAYFNHVSQRLARTWIALPADQRPDSWPRWRDEEGVGLDYFIGVRFWLGTPFVHSELLGNQMIALKFTEETRAVVEKETGTVDPHRKHRDAILNDIYGFPRLLQKGPPQGSDVTREGWTFWMCKLMDIHQPIVDRFLRYPYLNGITGRAARGDEKKWLEEVHHFAEADEDTVRRVREDVKKGRWTPLGEDSL
ncbi:hypothetical protein QBC35DRAFT_509342 [Podospora australis]|uniref:Uncharacterized protein n=1 Tax=Podospora australis TaxID=1536484 RepID=A0AAN6WM03_9PEZI|nr:hypothetical protein QBC35DRAFT_509342 [Podospora australis]